MKGYDIIIIGGGPAGLAASISAFDSGVKNVLIIERENELGGILNQCIHNGFGLARFKESLTGPEYAEKFIIEVKKRNINYLTNTTVISVGSDKTVTAINGENGVFTLKAKSIIFAMGCRERSRGAINVAGTRPSGVYSAGTAQKYVNILGYMPGKSVVILGSGDIGLIMARRMTLEGAKVHAVIEIMPYSSGLKRNIVQCLDDFDIPLYLNHTITEIKGEDRVTGVTVSRVDENRKPIKGTEIEFNCDTVLFSVGLIPENELSKQMGVELSNSTKGAIVTQDRQTNIEGVFVCGNVLQVHDLVDFVSEEAEIAGKASANYVLNGKRENKIINTLCKNGVSYVLPQKLDLNGEDDVLLFFRVNKVFKNCTVKVVCGDKVVVSKRKKICVPGEMETVLISKDKLKSLSQDVGVLVEGDEL